MWVQNVTDFLRFCHLNSPCRRVNITLIFMSSSSYEFRHMSREPQKQMFLLVSGGDICAPQRDTNMASHTKSYKFGYRIYPCIMRTFFTTFEAEKLRCALYTEPFVSEALLICINKRNNSRWLFPGLLL